MIALAGWAGRLRALHFQTTLRFLFASVLTVLVVLPAQANDARGVELVGAAPVQGRSSYQLVPHEQHGRWYLYVGHHPGKALNAQTGAVEENGTSVLDVTDPAHPIYLHHEPPSVVPGVAGGSTISGSYHFSICDGADLPHASKGRVYMLRTVGDVAHEIVDVTDPSKWRPVSQVVKAEPSDVDKARHTHNSVWDCSSGLAILVASKSGWHATQIFQAFDLSDPEKPVHVRDFDLPGSEPGSANPSGRVLPAAGYVNMAHAARIANGRIYLSYNPFWAGTVQILDLRKFVQGDPAVAHPLQPTAASLAYPQLGRLDFPSYWGVHSAEPILGMSIPDYRRDKVGAARDVLVTLSEGVVTQCQLARPVLFLLDITEPGFPIPIATYQASAADGGFCDRFTYFGPHNVQPQTASVYRGKLLFVTYFAAGLRVVDIRDPFKPVEVGHFIPNATETTRYIEQKGPLRGRQFEKTPLTNDVATDSRGYVYISDRAGTGVHILRISESIIKNME